MGTSTRLRTLTKPLVGATVAMLLLAACGDDDEAATTVVEPVEEQDTLVTPQLDGLEVTVTGNVTEQMDDHAFQIDKDGLGDESTTLASEEDGLDFEDDYYVGDYDLYDAYDYDYDYYDYDYYIAYDGEFDGFDETSVLVVTPGGVEVSTGEAVQVNGTLRYFDALEVSDVYNLDLEDDVFGSYENQYVLIADAVSSVPADRDSAMNETTTDDTDSTMATDDDAGPSAPSATDGVGEEADGAPATEEPSGDDRADDPDGTEETDGE